MKLMKLLPAVVALVLMVTTAIIQGNWTERWGEFAELQEFAKRIDDLPMEIGDWTGKDLPKMDKRTMEIAGAVGSLSRVYTHRLTDETVNVHVVCGRMQDVFYHTPERCYPAAGFSQNGATVKQSVMYGPDKSVAAEFRTTEFIKSGRSDVKPQPLRIFWTWSSDGKWEAPDSPKLAYAGQRALYKLYLENPVNSAAQQSVENTPAVQFAKIAMPELTKAFFPFSDAAKQLIPKVAPKLPSEIEPAIDPVDPAPDAILPKTE